MSKADSVKAERPAGILTRSFRYLAPLTLKGAACDVVRGRERGSAHT